MLFYFIAATELYTNWQLHTLNILIESKTCHSFHRSLLIMGHLDASELLTG